MKQPVNISQVIWVGSSFAWARVVSLSHRTGRDLEGSPGLFAWPSTETHSHSSRHASLFLKSSRKSSSVYASCWPTLVPLAHPMWNLPCNSTNFLKEQVLHFFSCSVFRKDSCRSHKPFIMFRDYISSLNPQVCFFILTKKKKEKEFNLYSIRYCYKSNSGITYYNINKYTLS